MKKIILSLVVLVGISFAASANSYKLNNNATEAKFATATDVTTDLTAATLQLTEQSNASALAKFGGSTTKSGFLIRAFFCGSFGIHRIYMGGAKKLIAYYLCTNLLGVGGIVVAIDFWYVIIKGDEALSKYSNNDKFFAFAGK